MVFLTDTQKKSKETEVVAAEKAATELKYKYFGPEGELYKKRQTLMEPIQDEIYNAIKKISEEKGYQCIFDRASSANIIFASPRIDISNEVLDKLGYSK
jgi:outer membrane protein